MSVIIQNPTLVWRYFVKGNWQKNIKEKKQENSHKKYEEETVVGKI